MVERSEEMVLGHEAWKEGDHVVDGGEGQAVGDVGDEEHGVEQELDRVGVDDLRVDEGRALTVFFVLRVVCIMEVLFFLPDDVVVCLWEHHEDEGQDEEDHDVEHVED